MFNVFLIIFLFLALGWLSLLILGTATKIIAIESKIDNLIKLQQNLEELLKLIAESMDSNRKLTDATNKIIEVQSKVINDYVDALTAQPVKKSKSKDTKKES